MRILATIRNYIGRRKGYGGCTRCGDTWNWKAEHVTEFERGRGCFPLCEECWQSLTPEQRLPYYMAHVDRCVAYYADRGKADIAMDQETGRGPIRDAVLAGR
jgi:hypothetical protein